MESLNTSSSLIGRSAIAIAAQLAGLPSGVLITLLVVIAAPCLVTAAVRVAAAAVALWARDERRAARALTILKLDQRENSRARSGTGARSRRQS